MYFQYFFFFFNNSAFISCSFFFLIDLKIKQGYVKLSGKKKKINK